MSYSSTELDSFHIDMLQKINSFKKWNPKLLVLFNETLMNLEKQSNELIFSIEEEKLINKILNQNLNLDTTSKHSVIVFGNNHFFQFANESFLQNQNIACASGVMNENNSSFEWPFLNEFKIVSVTTSSFPSNVIMICPDNVLWKDIQKQKNQAEIAVEQTILDAIAFNKNHDNEKLMILVVTKMGIDFDKMIVNIQIHHNTANVEKTYFSDESQSGICTFYIEKKKLQKKITFQDIPHEPLLIISPDETPNGDLHMEQASTSSTTVSRPVMTPKSIQENLKELKSNYFSIGQNYKGTTSLEPFVYFDIMEKSVRKVSITPTGWPEKRPDNVPHTFLLITLPLDVEDLITSNYQELQKSLQESKTKFPLALCENGEIDVKLFLDKVHKDVCRYWLTLLKKMRFVHTKTDDQKEVEWRTSNQSTYNEEYDHSSLPEKHFLKIARSSSYNKNITFYEEDDGLVTLTSLIEKVIDIESNVNLETMNKRFKILKETDINVKHWSPESRFFFQIIYKAAQKNILGTPGLEHHKVSFCQPQFTLQERFQVKNEHEKFTPFTGFFNDDRSRFVATFKISKSEH